MPHIQVIGLGGTIAGSLDAAGRSSPDLGLEDLIAGVSGLRTIAQIAPLDLLRKPSRALTLEDVCKLAARVREAAVAGFDGVVVLQGTDTLEETAYALALQVDAKIPVVLTGAMQPGLRAGADGPANITAALRVACDPRAAALGPVVVMADEVHLARFVAKTRTFGASAFASPGLGPVGSVVEGELEISALPAHNEYVGSPTNLPHQVDIVWTSLGNDGAAVKALVRTTDGLVVAGTGGGHVPPSFLEPLSQAVERRIPVVLASRVGGGMVLRRSYRGPGSETDLLELGLHPAGSLPPLKARLRLLVALASGRRVDETFARQ